MLTTDDKEIKILVSLEDGSPIARE